MTNTIEKIERILIANRGEIASRIIRTCNKMGIESVAIYSDADTNSTYTCDATFKEWLGKKSTSYLDAKKIIQIAKKFKCDAIHPGYGFLSENYDFAKLVRANNLIFIGPSNENLKSLGSKKLAKKLAKKCQVPIIKEYKISELKNGTVQFPVLVKASFGGGGKGMKIVNNQDEALEAIETSKKEALQFFGSSEIIVEGFLKNARHIEVQIVSDKYKNILELGTRECSLQRNNQKIVEEAPAIIPKEVEQAIIQSAITLCSKAKLENAATFEFILNADNTKQFFFLETNPRIQVEHTVTEEVYGVDIVELQIRSARGESFKEYDFPLQKGRHSIQCRVCSEDPSNAFAPTTGEIINFKIPKKNGIRIEHSLKNNFNVTHEFDSLLCKVISTAKDKNSAIINAKDYLSKELSIKGVFTNKDILISILDNLSLNPDATTNYIKSHLSVLNSKLEFSKILKTLSTFYKLSNVTQNCDMETRIIDRQGNCAEIKGKFFHKNDNLLFQLKDYTYKNYTLPKPYDNSYRSYENLFSINNAEFIVERLYQKPEVTNENQNGEIISPLPGEISDIFVKTGEKVKRGQKLLSIESMKIQHLIKSDINGEIEEVLTKKGLHTQAAQLLIKIKPQ